MFEIKTLIISDYISISDIPKVYNYFDYFNIAKLKNVTYYDHPETEYYAEDKPFYGFAIIEVEEWYNNNSAKFLYNAICENKGKMVYDDPFYWDVEFYNYENYKYSDEELFNFEEDISEIKEDINKEIYLNDENKVVDKNEDYNEDNNEDYNEDDEDDEDEDDDYEEVDNLKDEDYVYEEEDETNDLYYEFYKKYDNSSRSNKKRKYSATIENLKAENNQLRELLIKKQKNYKKNNKSKDKKFSWHRRLRMKINN